MQSDALTRSISSFRRSGHYILLSTTVSSFLPHHHQDSDTALVTSVSRSCVSSTTSEAVAAQVRLAVFVLLMPASGGINDLECRSIASRTMDKSGGGCEGNDKHEEDIRLRV